jgi:adenylate cyclase
LPVYGGAPSEDYPKANAAARKALELDASLAHPHAVLGSNEMEYDWDFAGGEAEYRKAFELDANDSTAHQWYADDIGRMGAREKEALAEANRALQLDPLSPIIGENVGDIFLFARRYDDAIAVCQKLANENPTFARAHSCLATAYWGKHMYAQVIEEQKAYASLAATTTIQSSLLPWSKDLAQGAGRALWVKASRSCKPNAKPATHRHTRLPALCWLGGQQSRR